MSPPAQDWTHSPERGSLLLVRFMAWLSLALGRGATRLLVRVIALYFFATAARARRASRDYLRRCLGREPTLAERHGLFLNFASTVHDRVYFLSDRFEPFEITTQGTATVDEGALVGLLADRTLGDEPVIRVPFLGEPAAFPTGPMRMAAALRQRVIFMAGTYQGGNRYEITFEPLADFTDLADVSRAERSRLVNAAVERYVERLEYHCRRSPGNWFNFHDFWKRA